VTNFCPPLDQINQSPHKLFLATTALPTPLIALSSTMAGIATTGTLNDLRLQAARLASSNDCFNGPSKLRLDTAVSAFQTELAKIPAQPQQTQLPPNDEISASQRTLSEIEQLRQGNNDHSDERTAQELFCRLDGHTGILKFLNSQQHARPKLLSSTSVPKPLKGAYL